ncbi:MAG: carboxypeptidase-like regulatory domain-containing protein [Bacteroidetes bacterium]|jgi:hypothetical protein|nr:carboxypeptidase-like regulatory domain-containing protein [Bacteroidota bacterium]MDF1865058.1 carboxypeptidase-like regulatory domain-containing protein [Saprospiraceae bacterium]
MINRRYLLFGLFFSFVIFSTSLFSQTFNVKLYSGQVLDVETQEPIIGAHIRIPGTEKGTVSDVNGYFEIELDSLPIIIVATYLGYDSATKTIRKNEKKIFAFYMKAAVTELRTLTVTAQSKIEKITKKDIAIRDFIFVGNLILGIGVENSFKDEQLILMDNNGDPLFIKSLSGIKKIRGLTRSCLGGLHLLTASEAFQIFIDAQGIHFEDPFPRWQYDKLMKPCVTSSNDFVYYERKTSNGKSITFEALPKDGGLAVEFGLAMDEDELERYLDDLYAMDIQLRATTSVSIQDPDELRALRRTEAVVDSWTNFFYQALNIQLFNLGEELCVFNHQDAQIEFFDLEGNFKRLVPIHYSKSKKWDGVIYLDEKQQRFYTRFNDPKGKVLGTIDLETGELISNTLVECMFIGKMDVFDGFLYYLESGVIAEDRNQILHKVRL